MLIFTSREARVRNLGVAVVNSGVTLVILLIAPMGLAGVVMNTLLVGLASFYTAATADRLVQFLQAAPVALSLDPAAGTAIQRRPADELDSHQ